MSSMWQDLELLVLVKTYPHPSLSHREVVCTAGMTHDSRWIRLYPVDYRYRPYREWFKKYEWIRVKARKHSRDQRPESYQPDPSFSIERLRYASSANGWKERKQIVFGHPVISMCALKRMPPSEKSLALVKPKEVIDLRIEADAPTWKARHLCLFQQLRLFGPEQRPLEKIPWRFSYFYFCAEENCLGHKQVILDWEIFELFRKQRDKSGEERAKQAVVENFKDQMCAADRDVHFFVGTIFKKRAWVVLGVF
ncbi:MAG: hypothetical protein NZ899_15060 [Thermoguttaceae bacterium]|nr:hypothetical protein [Thermoguttaceae bacterium]MDW8080244.1 hypothetical protein [Thermoguttaceae bacterium]